MKKSPRYLGLLCRAVALAAIAVAMPEAEASGPDYMPIHFRAGEPVSDKSCLGSVMEGELSDPFMPLKVASGDLKRLSGARARVVGFTDDRECAGANCDELAKRRAEIVRRWLIESGVEASRIDSSIGLGISMPLYPNEDDYGRSRNRRTEVQIYWPDEQNIDPTNSS